MTTAREALSAALRQVADTTKAAAEIRARAATDLTVTGADLAAADSEAELAQLRVRAAQLAAGAEEETERLGRVAAAADRFLAEEPDRRREFAEALQAARAAIAGVVAAGRAHDAVVDTIEGEAQQYAKFDENGRIVRRTAGPILVDRRPVRHVTSADWLTALLEEALSKFGVDPASYPASLFPDRKELPR